MSAKKVRGALPLPSYAGRPAEGACELVIITQNAAKKSIHICVQQDSRHWSQLGNSIIFTAAQGI